MGFIDRPQKVLWRRALFQIHLWLGVALGLYLIAISVSGAILVFKQELLDDAPRLEGTQAGDSSSYQELIEIALNAHPGNTLINVDMRTDYRRVIRIGLKSGEKDRIVFVDSVSRQIVGDQILQEEHPFVFFMEDLHIHLLGGETGEFINGIGGFFLCIMCFTGLVIWWQGKKNWKRSLKVKWNAGWKRINWDIHSAFGFWSLLMVAMWGLTGAYFVFPAQFQKVIAVISPMPNLQEKVPDWQPGQPILPLDVFYNKTAQMYPQSKLAYIYMDVYRPNGRVQIYLSRDPTVPMTLLEDVVAFHPGTGEILSDISSANWNFGERLSFAVYSIHFGDFGGIFFKILWCVFTLILVVIIVTGYLMWWNRVVRKKVFPPRKRLDNLPQTTD